MERFIVYFFIYGFFVLFPVTAPFIPEFDSPLGKVNPDMLWLFALTALFFCFVLRYPRRFRLSRLSGIALSVLIYYGFFFVNTFLKGRFNLVSKTEVSLIVSSFLVILLIENLTFVKGDKERLTKALSILAIVVFIGTILQVFVNQSLFHNVYTYMELQKIDFERFWRNGSIFDSTIQNQGGIAFIMLSAIFFFCNYERFSRYYVPIIILLSVSVFFTYGRYVMLGELSVAVAFCYFKAKKEGMKSYFAIVAALICFFLFYNYYGMVVKQSDAFNVRILADVSGRIEDPFTFFVSHLFVDHPTLFGTGFSSYDIEFYYGDFRRLHSGIWDVLFAGGFVWLIALFIVLLQFHKRARLVYRYSGDPVPLLFAPLYLIINLTSKLNLFFFWGYLLMLFYMNIKYRTLFEQYRAHYSKKPFIPTNPGYNRP